MSEAFSLTPAGPRAMPPLAVRIGGWCIVAAALVSLVAGAVRNAKGRGEGDDSIDVAPIQATATAQPLTTPPVTEADVRRWAREEMQASYSARAARSAKVEAADDGAAPADVGAVPGAAPTSPTATPTPPAKPQAQQQIPF